MKRSPSSSRSVSKRVPTSLSSVIAQAEHVAAGRGPLGDAARSSGDRPRSAPRALPTANGSDGWLSTGATMRSSTIIASAKPPVKHIRRRRRPARRTSSCTWRARARSQPITGDVRPGAHVVNSRETHTAAHRPGDVDGRAAVARRAEQRRHHHRDPGLGDVVGEAGDPRA